MKPPRRPEQMTPLIEPPTELTQKAPNKGPIAKEVTVEALQAHPHIQAPNSPPSTTRPQAKIAAPPRPPPPPMPEPPQMQAGNRDAQPPRGLPVGPPAVQPMQPQIQEQEKPKLAFETPTAPPPSGGQGGCRASTPPCRGRSRHSSATAARQSGMTVGDDTSDRVRAGSAAA